MRNIIISSAVAALSLAAISTPAAAQEQVRTAYVEHADLNVGTEKGMETLQNRVRAAVRQVCPAAEYGPVSRTLDARRCSDFAMEAAQQQIAQLRRGTVEILAVRAPQRSDIRRQ
ncbi:UrcA family protein [Aurantiacibacter hainanensis]|uniref:UrcA family protein n=1 Tax=Aurantiacibacter hainanensis TaxID=3076114 RepID=UPI0030C755CD